MKKPITPRSQVRNALRNLWLRSRERVQALKLAGYTCHECGRKQSEAKGRKVAVQVHHMEGIGNWEEAIDVIYSELLCPPNKLEVLCVDCHKKRHEEEKP